MWNSLLYKLLNICISIFLLSTLTFVLLKTIPGDPFQQEQALPLEIYEALRSHYGLNDPISVQYLRYLGQLVTFDFGPSFIYKDQNVTNIILESFPVSVLLGSVALTFAITFGLLLGVAAGLNHSKWQDVSVSIIAVVGVSIPSFVMATLLQYLLAIKLGLLPIARWGSFLHVILPALSLAALPIAFIARMTRIKIIEEMKQGYILTARANGLSETKIVVFHVLRNIVGPILSYLGPLAASILTGSFIVEKIYSIPGLGYWFVSSVSNRDYPMIMGIAVFYCTFLLAITFLMDLFTAYLDPRMRRKL